MLRRIGLALALLALCVPLRVRAHQPGLSRAEVRIAPARVSVDLVFARPEIAGLVPGADADGDGLLGEIELLSIETLLSEQVLQGIQVSAGEAACAGAIERIAFVEEDGLSVAAGFRLPAGAAAPDAVTLRFPLLARLAPGHRLLGRAHFTDMSQGPGSSAEPLDFVAHRRRSGLTIRRPAPAPAPAPVLAAAPPTAAAPPAPVPARWPWLVLAAALLLLGVGVFRRRRPRPYPLQP